MHVSDTPISCETLEPLLAAAALGDVDPDARTALEAHTQTCAVCRATLAAYKDMARLLPLGIPEAPLPPGLRARVLDAVEAAATGATPRRRWRSLAPRNWPRWLAPALVAALLVSLLLWNIALQQRLGEAQTVQDRQAVALAELLRQPQLEHRRLTSGPPSTGAWGTITLARNKQVAAVSVAGFVPLPQGKVYQVWLIKNGQRTSGGTFTVDAAGHGTLVIEAPQPLADYDAVGVSIEPRGGSPSPTTPRVVGGPLT